MTASLALAAGACLDLGHCSADDAKGEIAAERLVDKPALPVSFRAMERDSGPRFLGERERPLPKIGVWRAMLQGGVHDDARLATEKPLTEKTYEVGGCRGFWD